MSRDREDGAWDRKVHLHEALDIEAKPGDQAPAVADVGPLP